MRTILVPVALFATALPGCPDDHAHGAPADIIYESGGTDEVWLTFEDTADIVDDAMAPSLVAPASPLDRAGSLPVFEWMGGAVALAVPRKLFDATPRWRWAEVFQPVGVARAHEPPVTDTMYRLILTIPGERQFRVITGETAYTPSAAVWETLTASQSPISVEITGAYFMTGRIEEGPFRRAQPASVTFQ